MHLVKCGLIIAHFKVTILLAPTLFNESIITRQKVNYSYLVGRVTY